MFEGTTYRCRIADCKVFAQGHAALCRYYQQLKEYRSITLVDIGGYTVDVLTVHNFRLDRSSCASLRMPYADYELAKMYRDGVGTAVNIAEAARHFKIAFQGFQQMEKQSRDDKLQYRLGQMLYTGTGTEKDVEAALGYFEKSARLGNVHAQYMRDFMTCTFYGTREEAISVFLS